MDLKMWDDRRKELDRRKRELWSSYNQVKRAHDQRKAGETIPTDGMVEQARRAHEVAERDFQEHLTKKPEPMVASGLTANRDTAPSFVLGRPDPPPPPPAGLPAQGAAAPAGQVLSPAPPAPPTPPTPSPTNRRRRIIPAATAVPGRTVVNGLGWLTALILLLFLLPCMWGGLKGAGSWISSWFASRPATVAVVQTPCNYTPVPAPCPPAEKATSNTPSVPRRVAPPIPSGRPEGSGRVSQELDPDCLRYIANTAPGYDPETELGERKAREAYTARLCGSK